MPEVHFREPAAVRRPRTAAKLRRGAANGARPAAPVAVPLGRAGAGAGADAAELPQAVHVARRDEARQLPRRGRGGDGAAAHGHEAGQPEHEPRRQRRKGPARRREDLDE